MPYRIWQVAFLAILTTSIGINYTIYEWFDYTFLGIVKGMLFKSLTIWGYASMVLGIIMLIGLALRQFINVKVVDKNIEYCMIITFVLQLPITSLWFLAMVMSGANASSGVIIHSLVIILTGIIFLTSHLLPRNRSVNRDHSVVNR